MSDRPTINKGGLLGSTPFAGSLPAVEKVLIETLPMTGGAGRGKGKIDLEGWKQQVKEEARAEGYAAGFAQGMAEGQNQGRTTGQQQAYAEASAQAQQQIAAFNAKIQQILDEASVGMVEWFSRTEVEITELVNAICMHVLRKELSSDRAQIKDLVVFALQQITGQASAKIRINPFDAAVARSYKNEILQATVGYKDIHFVEDADIYGGCIIETEGPCVDATFERQLSNFFDETRRAA